jgi:hypothetical protein
MKPLHYAGSEGARGAELMREYRRQQCYTEGQSSVLIRDMSRLPRVQCGSALMGDYINGCRQAYREWGSKPTINYMYPHVSDIRLLIASLIVFPTCFSPDTRHAGSREVKVDVHCSVGVLG